MSNRLTRDQLILRALDVVQLANLKKHDAPNNVVQNDAYMIDWLQDIIDFWYHIVPFSSTVTTATLNATANQNYIDLPSDFIIDVRNGYVVQTVSGDSNSYKRTIRVPLQKWITRQLASQGKTNVQYPIFYCVQGRNSTTKVQQLRITPTPTVSTAGLLWYYQLPVRLNAEDLPTFPNDYACIEYLRIRALEWARLYEPGQAQKFCNDIVAKMQVNGLMNESEDDEIPFDQLVYRPDAGHGSAYYTTYAWMGPR